MKHRIIIWIAVLMAGCSVAQEVQPEPQPWKLAQDKNGIQIYTRPIEGNDLIEFKGITLIETSITSLLALIRDVEATPQWVANCTTSKVLERINDHETVTLSFSDAPWPVMDREAVVHNVITIDPNTSVVTVRQTGKPDYIEAKEKVIRVQRLEGFWQFTPKQEGQVEVVYQLLSDPSGDLPAWLVNSSIISQPYETLRDMKKIVQQDKYQHADTSPTTPHP